MRAHPPDDGARHRDRRGGSDILTPAGAREPRYAWKLLPHPQLEVEFGLLITNPAPWKLSS